MIRKIVMFLLVFVLMSCASLDFKSKSLRLDRIVFASQVSAYQDYEEKANAVFKIYETLYIYTEIRNLTVVDNSVSVLLIIKLIGPDGSVIIEQPFVNYEGVVQDPFISIPLTVPYGTSPGEYTIELTLTDRLSGDVAVQSGSFRVNTGTEI